MRACVSGVCIVYVLFVFHNVAHRACCTSSERFTTEGASSCRCAGLRSSPRLLSCIRGAISQDTPEHCNFWSLLSVGSVGGLFHECMVPLPPFSHLPPFLTQISEHRHTSSEHGVRVLYKWSQGCSGN